MDVDYNIIYLYQIIEAIVIPPLNHRNRKLRSMDIAGVGIRGIPVADK